MLQPSDFAYRQKVRFAFDWPQPIDALRKRLEEPNQAEIYTRLTNVNYYYRLETRRRIARLAWPRYRTLLRRR